MLCFVKSVSVRLCGFPSRLIKFDSASQHLLKSFQRNYASDEKEEQSNAVDGTQLSRALSTQLIAKWKWVVRGNYKVAAFTTDNNPAIAIDVKAGRYWHSHKCPNCLTVYEHDHPYGSLLHPQHIKDCPKCKVLAPADLKIGKFE